jgi:hypothetical protein
MVATVSRHPGITFEAHTPPVVSPLPRMDIAGFVGFAPSGPVNLPVAVEDITRFHDIFGRDLPVARDRDADAVVYAELPPAVRAFFRNGGARCWVVRVAGERAVANRFAIPGMLAAPVGAADIRAGIAFARSPGSWSDSLTVNATLARLPLAVTAVSPPSDGAFRVSGLPPGALIQIDFPDRPDLVAFQPVGGKRGGAPAPVDLPTPDAYWFRRAAGTDFGLASPPEGVTWLPAPLAARWMCTVHPEPEPVLPLVAWGVTDEDAFVLEFSRQSATGVQPGSWIAVELASAPSPARPLLLLLIDSIESASGTASPPASETIRATASRAWWPLDANAAVQMAAGLDVRAALVNFELWAREPDRPVRRLADLEFVPPHPLYWGDVPDDVIAFEEEDEHPSRRESIAPLLLDRVMNPRYPLAAPPRERLAAAPVFIPLGIAGVLRDEFYQAALPQPGDALTRDGLATLSAALFIDPELRGSTAASLMADAFQVLYVQQYPGTGKRAGRRLTGLHALLPIEQVSMIAIPDAVQRPWFHEPSQTSPPGAPTLIDVTPEPCRVRARWTAPAGEAPVAYRLQASLDPRFEAVARSWDVAATELIHPDGIFPSCGVRVFYRVRALSPTQGAGPWSNTGWAIVPEAPFAACPDEQPAAPHPVTIAEEGGRLVVAWGFSSTADVVFTLERASDPEFASASVVYRGPDPTYEVLRSADPIVYFRVAADVAGVQSPWSVTASAGVITHEAYGLDPASAYDDGLLSDVHTALIRLCAARGDAHAVLGLPGHFREDTAAGYVAALSSALSITDAIRVLSYAAVFHPWVVVRETSGRPELATWAVPPDGAVCGTIAARTLQNGAWYSPANQLLVGALALSPPIADAALALHASRVNPIVQQPRGFVAMDALTLHPGDEFGELHVRRLLILLRRLALREGAAFVFRSNDDALRRLVERQFEQVLGDLFVRGAFAGARHEDGYTVVADDTVNTRQGREAGRFVVELRVAPSQPLMFLTVRLVQEGGAWQATEEA